MDSNSSDQPSQVSSQVSHPSTRTTRNWFRSSFRFVAYWFNLIVQPLVAVAFVVTLAWLFGYAQRNYDWFQDAETSLGTAEPEENAQYACSMLCTFVGAPGRCPVCGMELQKIEVKGDPKDLYGVTIDPAARRLANIKTVSALNVPVSNQVEVLGRITYDETTETNITAYVDGRIEELLVNFTGATVRKGDPFAVIYSPDLYADQVGLIEAKKASQSVTGNQRVDQANKRLYQSARRRLIEKGILAADLDALESSGKPNSRIKVTSPSSGTVIKKLVSRGDEVKTGETIFKVANLSTVWLMLEMYPEDTRNLKLGQSVSVEIRSQAGKTYEGKISFIAPMVEAKTQTVNVRVAIPNEAGLIKIGDFGKAKIHSHQSDANSLVVVPRESVLMNGSDSIAYVETTPGRFEFRKVTVAEILDDRISISKGIEAGEQIAASGVFLLDSTFNIQGKVSLIDPNRVHPQKQDQLAKKRAEKKEIEASFKDLSAQDLRLANSQVICPVSEVKLGTKGMGAPINVDVDGTPVMICCEGCRSSLLETPKKYFKILGAYRKSTQRNSNQSLNQQNTKEESSEPDSSRSRSNTSSGISPDASLQREGLQR